MPLLLLVIASVTPTHEVRDLEGWTVEVDRRLLGGDQAEVGKRALRIIANQLFEIAAILPEKRVAELRRVRIRVDLDHPLGGLQYHPSKRWLVRNGHAADLARCVHVPQARRLVGLHGTNVQPWVMLHELAHAWHDQVLGFDHAGVRATYERIEKAGILESVLHAKGRKVRHYALKDHKEFFAEMTEAWFGTNDFYPFLRAEMQVMDADLAAFMEKIWNR